MNTAAILAGISPATTAASGAANAATPASATPDGANPFGNLLRSAISGVDSLEQQASSAVTGLLGGNGVDIHDAMIATQRADMAFETALAVRSKAVAAYQQVMSMQF